MNLDTVSMDISDFALKGRCIFNVDQYCDSWTCEKHQAFHTQWSQFQKTHMESQNNSKLQ